MRSSAPSEAASDDVEDLDDDAVRSSRRGARLQPITGSATERIRVLIVDDHLLFAEAIQPALRALGLDVVGVATTMGSGFEAALELSPDLVLIDVDLPDGTGIELGTRLIAELQDVKVVALTETFSPEMIRESLAKGFSGYISKGTRSDTFGQAVLGVLDGQIVVPQRLSADEHHPSVPESGWRNSHEGLLARQLTPRELQVLELLAQGAASPDIAARLGVSANTVRTHVQGILSKLQVHSRLEAAAFAVRNRLVQVGP